MFFNVKVITFGQFLGFVGSHRFAAFVLNEFVAPDEDAVLGFAWKVLNILNGTIVFAHRCVEFNANPGAALQKKNIFINSFIVFAKRRDDFRRQRSFNRKENARCQSMPTEKCVGPMKLMTPLWLYGRMRTDSLSAIQSGNGASVCDVVISLESESLLVASLVSSSMYVFGVGVVVVNVWLWLSRFDVLRMFWLLSSSRMIIFLFSSFCCCCCCSGCCAVASLCIALSVAFSDGESTAEIDVGVSFMNGLKRFWPLPGVYGVVVSWEFCLGGDEPVRSKSETK